MEQCRVSIPHNPPIKNSQRNVSQTVIQCNYCKKLGHSIEQCYKRKYNNNKNQENDNRKLNKETHQIAITENPRGQSSKDQVLAHQLN